MNSGEEPATVVEVNQNSISIKTTSKQAVGEGGEASVSSTVKFFDSNDDLIGQSSLGLNLKKTLKFMAGQSVSASSEEYDTSFKFEFGTAFETQAAIPGFNDPDAALKAKAKAEQAVKWDNFNFKITEGLDLAIKDIPQENNISVDVYVQATVEWLAFKSEFGEWILGGEYKYAFSPGSFDSGIESAKGYVKFQNVDTSSRLVNFTFEGLKVGIQSLPPSPREGSAGVGGFFSKELKLKHW